MAKPSRAARRLLAIFVAAASAHAPRDARADPPSSPLTPMAPSPPGSFDDPVRAPTPAAPGAEDAPAALPTPAPAGGHWVFVEEKATPPPTPPPSPAAARFAMSGPVFERKVTWDLNIDGAIGRYFGDTDKWTGFVRARAGVLFIRAPFFDALGLTYEYSSLSKATLGVQAEVMHLELGGWAQVGALLDVTGTSGPRVGAMAALGWSLFGVEAQVRSYEGLGTGVAVYAKLRVPISVIAQLFAPTPTPAQAAAPGAASSPTVEPPPPQSRK